MRRAVILLACMLAFVGCSEKKQTASPAVDLGDSKHQEWLNESIGGITERENVRKAVIEDLSPAECTIEGLSTSEVNGNLFLVAADLKCGERRSTINLVVRRFYPLGNQQPYWKTEPLTPDLAQALGVRGGKKSAAVDKR